MKNFILLLIFTLFGTYSFASNTNPAKDEVKKETIELSLFSINIDTQEKVESALRGAPVVYYCTVSVSIGSITGTGVGYSTESQEAACQNATSNALMNLTYAY